MNNPKNNNAADLAGKSRQENGTWGSCPQGAVADVVHNVRSKRRHQSLARVATVGGGVAAILLMAGLALWSAAGNPPGGDPAQPPTLQIRDITCRDAIRQLPDYLAGRIGHEAELQIDQHMRKCPNCRKHIPSDHPKAHLLAGIWNTAVQPLAVFFAATR